MGKYITECERDPGWQHNLSSTPQSIKEAMKDVNGWNTAGPTCMGYRVHCDAENPDQTKFWLMYFHPQRHTFPLRPQFQDLGKYLNTNAPKPDPSSGMVRVKSLGPYLSPLEIIPNTNVTPSKPYLLTHTAVRYGVEYDGQSGKEHWDAHRIVVTAQLKWAVPALEHVLIDLRHGVLKYKDTEKKIREVEEALEKLRAMSLEIT